jgi:ribosomal protein S12 methylthiotransferase accessory factor
MQRCLRYLGNDARAEGRAALAETIFHLPYSSLLKYGISSYRQIDGLDIIGVPIWVCYRPLATTISVTAGKNPDTVMSCVGSIVEAIEFWASENPNSAYKLCSYADIKKDSAAEVLPLQDYPLARDNILDENTPVAWEVVHHLGSGKLVWMPSHMVWLKDRVLQQFLDVQQSSNGLASGIDIEDAVLQALYELVERDGWTCNQFIRESIGTPPLKVPLVGLPPELEWSVALMRKAGLYPFLYDCTQELGIPVMACALFGRDGVGLFGGYGCSQSLRVAAQRALLESIQSRLCYISGARDDLYRRDFILMKRHSSEQLIGQLEMLAPVKPTWAEFAAQYPEFKFSSIKEELSFLLGRLSAEGIDRLYYAQLAREDFGEQKLYVVKAVAPQLEGAWCEQWKTNGRAPAALAREIKKADAGS